MNDKLSFPDLVTLFSTKLDVTKKEAEAFLKEFFTLASEVIASGEELRIDGLGKFKPVWVASRTSVNVQTGESMEIPGHYRLSFLPDKVLRDAVNAPFSFFEVEILNDRVSIEDMLPPEELPVVEGVNEDMTEESVVVLPEAPVEAPVVENESEPEVPAGESPSQPVQEEPIAVCEETVITQDAIPEGELDPPSVVNDVPEATDEIEDDDEEDDERVHTTSRRYFWWGALSAVGILVIALLVGGYIFYRNGELKIGNFTLTMGKEAVIEPSSELITDVEIDNDSLNTIQDSLSVKMETPAPVVEKEVADKELSQSRQSVLLASVTRDTIKSGVFLTTLSLRHYGHKAFWVYIYEENKAIIKNPDMIPIGTEVIIPNPAKYGIDANNQAAIDTAKVLADKIKGK